ncbi:MAG: hypothetical protein ACJ8R9_18055 [Steroidobacteraceae bacterium]
MRAHFIAGKGHAQPLERKRLEDLLPGGYFGFPLGTRIDTRGDQRLTGVNRIKSVAYSTRWAAMSGGERGAKRKWLPGLESNCRITV